MNPTPTAQIMRDFAQRLDASRREVKAKIEADLCDQGASADRIADSLRGFDELFDEGLLVSLTEFASRLGPVLRALHDPTNTVLH